jgi:hypothetical protein
LGSWPLFGPMAQYYIILLLYCIILYYVILCYGIVYASPNKQAAGFSGSVCLLRGASYMTGHGSYMPGIGFVFGGDYMPGLVLCIVLYYILYYLIIYYVILCCDILYTSPNLAAEFSCSVCVLCGASYMWGRGWYNMLLFSLVKYPQGAIPHLRFKRQWPEAHIF